MAFSFAFQEKAYEEYYVRDMESKKLKSLYERMQVCRYFLAPQELS